jgi:hypothetical protein
MQFIVELHAIARRALAWVGVVGADRRKKSVAAGTARRRAVALGSFLGSIDFGKGLVASSEGGTRDSAFITVIAQERPNARACPCWLSPEPSLERVERSLHTRGEMTTDSSFARLRRPMIMMSVESPAKESKDEPRSSRPGSTRALVALLAFVLGFATVPHRVCERDAAKWFNGDPAKIDTLAAGVARWTMAELTPTSFATGSSRFDGEWLFATYMMSAMGFGQLALERRELSARDANITRMEHCIDAMLDARVLAFDAKAWGGDALTSLEASPGSADDRGHVGLLGYSGLVLALHRTLRPDSRFTAIEEKVIGVLARRIEASPIGLVETYPNEVYPVDNTSALAALAVHAHATKQPDRALTLGLEAIRTRSIDPVTGLLFQAVSVADGKPRDAARASGSALATYFLAFADEPTSSALFHALERRQFRTVLGFGGMMEYPAGRERGPGDIDSGPVVLGFGVSASGFALGASRAHGDRETFTALWATAHLFGAPLDEGGTRTYATGGPIGDAILFAMLTTPRAGRFS